MKKWVFNYRNLDSLFCHSLLCYWLISDVLFIALNSSVFEVVGINASCLSLFLWHFVRYEQAMRLVDTDTINTFEEFSEEVYKLTWDLTKRI